MPTVLIYDVSLSMLGIGMNGLDSDNNEAVVSEYSYRSLAQRGLNVILSHLETHFKLESVALLTFSSLYEKVSGFTRDLNHIRNKIQSLDNYDRTRISSALTGLSTLIQEEWWGSSVPINVILVTDGFIGNGPQSLKKILGIPNSFPPILFKGTLNVMCLANPQSKEIKESKIYYEKLIEKLKLRGRVWNVTESTPEAVDTMFENLIRTQYQQFTGVLHFGGNNMSCRISLSPPPSATNYKGVNDFDVVEAKVNETIEILGFLTLSEIASPPVVSRHLILPLLDDNSSPEAQQQPSLVVFLHGALKVSGMCALVRVDESWFGILFSNSDTKKKSSLLLSLLEPGPIPVPWLGNLHELGPKADLNDTTGDVFPIRKGGGSKPSYSSNPVVWIKHSSLQSDIQKILRHARKLPEKTAHFYKELNRLKRAAICLGFHELLEGVAVIFDKECTVLPASSNPDCAIQLTHAASELRSRNCLNIDYSITPYSTKFTNK